MSQNLKDLDVSIPKIEEVFFESMLVGYASDEEVKKKTIPALPGYKCIEFIKKDFRVLDAYCAHPNSDVSHGFTTIWHKNMPIWVMHYGGRYPKECIEFLKSSLFLSYRAHCFNGGRGPVFSNGTFSDNLGHMTGHLKYRYINNVEEDSSFVRFAGREYIAGNFQTAEVDKVFGYHDYFGGLITPRG